MIKGYGNAVLTLPKARPSWSTRNQKWTNVELRRTLFELHAGREASHLPTDLPVQEVIKPSSDSNVLFDTSEELIDALGPIGQDYARPKEYAWMADLSFVDPLLAATDHYKAIQKAKEARERYDNLSTAANRKIGGKSILVNYLLHVDSILRYRARSDQSALSDVQMNRGLLKVFDRDASKWLNRRAYDVTHVMNWAWILTADTSERAALRLMMLASDYFGKKTHTGGVPQFLFTFLLRRTSIDARALKPLLVYAWKMMEHSESMASISPSDNGSNHSHEQNVVERHFVKDDHQGMSEQIFLIIIIRLLRRARKAWPAACESIVALLNRYLDGINFRKEIANSVILHPHDVDQLTYAYNTMLRLLSLPSPMHPFQSAIFQQRAQFSLLRRMNRFEPPLSVDKRGYRAVVKMQLMHKKTLQEREWAHLKAKSWPPWKEERLGIDVDIGVEQGVSRAKEALIQAEEAGYSTDRWDAAAGILSGWDTDGSPTIQTRVILKYPVSVPMYTKERGEGLIWAARIQATRTVEEAWSCFLACKRQTGIASIKEPSYHAMFKKLLHNPQKLRSKELATSPKPSLNKQHLPGDGLEASPVPESPREAIYIPRPVPNAGELLEMMEQDGVKPSGRLLTFLLTKTWSFEAGVKCLFASGLLPQQVSSLFYNNPGTDLIPQHMIDSMPQQLFAGLIEFLVRFAPTLADKHECDRFERIKTGQTLDIPGIVWSRPPSEDELSTAEPYQFNPLSRAYKLLLSRKPTYRTAWFALLRGLARPKAVTSVYSSFANQNSQDIKTFRMSRHLLNEMAKLNIHVDLDGFLIICTALEKAMFACARRRQARDRLGVQDEDNQEGNDDSSRNTNRELEVVSEGLSLVKSLFKDAVRSVGMLEEIPDKVSAGENEIYKTTKKVVNRTDDEDSEDRSSEHLEDSKFLLPPACLLPKLLEIPHPAHLHAFIRVLGLQRDYDGILDLVEWMALFADEINVLVEEAMNGHRMMRRCITAVRVFLERSWMHVRRDDGCDLAGHDGVVIEADPAPPEVVAAVRDIVLENRRWGGWATGEEVTEYCLRGRFL